jgi:hypothetical protein
VKSFNKNLITVQFYWLIDVSALNALYILKGWQASLVDCFMFQIIFARLRLFALLRTKSVYYLVLLYVCSVGKSV